MEHVNNTYEKNTQIKTSIFDQDNSGVGQWEMK